MGLAASRATRHGPHISPPLALAYSHLRPGRKVPFLPLGGPRPQPGARCLSRPSAWPRPLPRLRPRPQASQSLQTSCLRVESPFCSSRRLETRSFLPSTAEAATGPGLGSGPGRRAGASNEWRRGPAGSALRDTGARGGSPSAPASGRVTISGRRLGNATGRPSASPPPLPSPFLLSRPGPRGLGQARGLRGSPLLALMLSPDYGTYGWAAKRASNSVVTDPQSDRASDFNSTGIASRGHFFTTPNDVFMPLRSSPSRG